MKIEDIPNRRIETSWRGELHYSYLYEGKWIEEGPRICFGMFQSTAQMPTSVKAWMKNYGHAIAVKMGFDPEEIQSLFINECIKPIKYWNAIEYDITPEKIHFKCDVANWNDWWKKLCGISLFRLFSSDPDIPIIYYQLRIIHNLPVQWAFTLPFCLYSDCRILDHLPFQKISPKFDWANLREYDFLATINESFKSNIKGIERNFKAPHIPFYCDYNNPDRSARRDVAWLNRLLENGEIK